MGHWYTGPRENWGFPVTVRVVCDRCGKFLAEMYGEADDGPFAYWDRSGASGNLVDWLPVVWRCVNGHGGPYRPAKLTTAYLKVASRGSPRERVIRLPRDVSGLAGTPRFGGTTN